eukprot:scaffold1469_cov119-Cylindrotheca_fusiformis.AAC.44
MKFIALLSLFTVAAASRRMHSSASRNIHGQGWGLDNAEVPFPSLDDPKDPMIEEVKPVKRVVKPEEDRKPVQKKGFLWGKNHVTDLDRICFLE